MDTFYLGTHIPKWLETSDIPLFVSRRQLAKRVRPVYAATDWVLDSGGFSELRLFGKWTITPDEYAREVERKYAVSKNLNWVAPMDYMCEPNMVAKTGLSVGIHQELTIMNFLDLRGKLGELVIPVLQGWTLDEYLENILQYAEAGVDLSKERIVGVGSVCRRNQDAEIVQILREIANRGIRIHAFGVRSQALVKVSPFIVSADSMAWSYRARNSPALPGHPHMSCQNCWDFAARWWDDQMHAIERAES